MSKNIITEEDDTIKQNLSIQDVIKEIIVRQKQNEEEIKKIKRRKPTAKKYY